MRAIWKEDCEALVINIISTEVLWNKMNFFIGIFEGFYRNFDNIFFCRTPSFKLVEADMKIQDPTLSSVLQNYLI